MATGPPGPTLVLVLPRRWHSTCSRAFKMRSDRPMSWVPRLRAPRGPTRNGKRFRAVFIPFGWSERHQPLVDEQDRLDECRMCPTRRGRDLRLSIAFPTGSVQSFQPARHSHACESRGWRRASAGERLRHRRSARAWRERCDTAATQQRRRAAKAAVIEDTGGHERMCKLEQDRPRPAEQHDPLRVDAPRDRRSGLRESVRLRDADMRSHAAGTIAFMSVAAWMRRCRKSDQLRRLAGCCAARAIRRFRTVPDLRRRAGWSSTFRRPLVGWDVASR